MALRWAGAAMQEAAKAFRRLKAYKQLPLLQAALAVRKAKATSSNAHLVQTTKAAQVLNQRRTLRAFQHKARHRPIPEESQPGPSSTLRAGWRMCRKLLI
jgi:hypothetical protein